MNHLKLLPTFTTIIFFMVGFLSSKSQKNISLDITEEPDPIEDNYDINKCIWPVSETTLA